MAAPTRVVVASLFSLLLAACGGAHTADDAATSEDVESYDAQDYDAQDFDSGTEEPDSGPVDSGRADAAAPPLVHYTESRPPCTTRSALRRAYFGDLHVHTAMSFDAYAFETRGTPDDAYRFARGERVMLPPLDAQGRGTRPAQLARPLDFAAVTDHSEWLGETHMCTTPGAQGYNSATCVAFRRSDGSTTDVVSLLGAAGVANCGGPGMPPCSGFTSTVWTQVQRAASRAYDATASCRFTAFAAYEYSGSYNGAWAHRNVIFRNHHVPAMPVSVRETPTPWGMWNALRASCLDAGTGCDVLAIPHNSNFTAGNQFSTQYPGATTIDAQRARATLRARLEPLMEIVQHKGASECFNHLLFGSPDELCEYEDLVPRGTPLCGAEGNSVGTDNFACVARNDYLRGILEAGLRERQRLGVDPFHVGVVASTDTHSATPGAVSARDFYGHQGADDSSPRLRLSRRPHANPGGLAGVWAVENSRDALFEAMSRRETFGTSGPRIAVRFFGGWSYPTNLCSNAQMISRGYSDGVPMGGTLPARPAGATGGPRFVIQALRDATLLQRVQVIKGWYDADGKAHDRIFHVAGDARSTATVNLATCAVSGTGSNSLCTVWTDPSFDPRVRAFYYVRVLENPTCHWTQWDCNDIPLADRPAWCADATRPRRVQQRAWTSPIWYEPAGS